jgi:isoamylase
MSTVPTARSDLFANLAAGTSSPLGATPGPDGVNFSVYSSRATGVELLLFAHANDSSAARVIRINPATNRTYHYWHVFVLGVSPGQIYGYRVEGPRDPTRGMRFDPTKIAPPAKLVTMPPR